MEINLSIRKENNIIVFTPSNCSCVYLTNCFQNSSNFKRKKLFWSFIKSHHSLLYFEILLLICLLIKRKRNNRSLLSFSKTTRPKANAYLHTIYLSCHLKYYTLAYFSYLVLLSIFKPVNPTIELNHVFSLQTELRQDYTNCFHLVCFCNIVRCTIFLLRMLFLSFKLADRIHHMASLKKKKSFS